MYGPLVPGGRAYTDSPYKVEREGLVRQELGLFAPLHHLRSEIPRRYCGPVEFVFPRAEFRVPSSGVGQRIGSTPAAGFNPANHGFQVDYWILATPVSHLWVVGTVQKPALI